MFLLLIACADSVKNDATSTELAVENCAATLTVPFLGWGLSLQNCPPDGWQSYVQSTDALANGPFVAGAYVANFDISPPDPGHTVQESEVQTNIFAWSLDDYVPDIFAGADTVYGGMVATRQAEVEANVGWVSDLVALTIDGHDGWYFVERIRASDGTQWSYPGVTAVFMLVEIDGQQGWVLNYSSYLGGAPATGVTSDPATWPDLLTAYWAMVQGTTINPT